MTEFQIKLTLINITSTVREIPARNLPEIRETFLPVVKSEIQIRENLFPRNTKNQQSAKLIKLPRKFHATRYVCKFAHINPFSTVYILNLVDILL